ncbi:TIGR02680 family protein [Nakamurella sp. YIM 132087]|uniref:TIGR02680 family protein n=1 Tax=Nakamurella alba TaxID=2665158 RepID=A0A7K1FPJ2_9ACTN|nr:TIGR02680 family protein [Nakamurella alba]MTD15143.1 TIGR02680 family protein [Nakamurella alba]
MTDRRHFPDRWRLHRAGMVNVWHYLDNEFDISGGRMVLRGTNGSGKSRALELLLPFLLDGDRRRMDATGAAKVNLDELMRTGAGEQANRIGYLWLELARPGGYLTIGALLRRGQSAQRTQVWYFTTPKRVGHELTLLADDRSVLSRDQLGELIGVERITDVAEAHRDRIRSEVFGLRGDAGRDRFAGLLQLLYTLRAPDVGNRIDEGRLPQLISDSLPPLREQALAAAGEQLDGLTSTREAQLRTEETSRHVDRMLSVYRRYAAGVLLDSADTAAAAVDAVVAAQREAEGLAIRFEALQEEHVGRQTERQDLHDQQTELESAIDGMRQREIFKQADDLAARDRAVAAQRDSTATRLSAAASARKHHSGQVAFADSRARELEQVAGELSGAIIAARGALGDAGLPAGGLPQSQQCLLTAVATTRIPMRTEVDGDPQQVDRPLPLQVRLQPDDRAELVAAARTAGSAAEERREHADRRRLEATKLERELRQVQRLEQDAEQEAVHRDRDLADAETAAETRDNAAVALAGDWRRWVADPVTLDLLGPVDWPGSAVGPLLLDAEALLDPSVVVEPLDREAAEQAQPARDALVARRRELDDADTADDLAREALLAEAADLRAARDPAPPRPPWRSGEPVGVPLWRAVDFASSLGASERAGLEAALLDSGLLTAVLDADRLLAASGEVLLVASGAVVAQPVSSVLVADPDSGVASSVVEAVLARIGLDDADAAASVGVDGGWRLGPLHGRHQVPEARHIGAQARARRREARLAEIAAEIEVLDVALAERSQERVGIDERVVALAAHVRAAPTSAALSAARTAAQLAAERAESSRRRAAEAADRAVDRRRQWATASTVHVEACAHFGLPVGIDELAVVISSSRVAAERCSQLIAAAARLDRAVAHHTEAVAAELAARTERDTLEEDATRAWNEWMREASQVAAQHEALDFTVEQARIELERSRRSLSDVVQQIQRADKLLAALGPDVGRAESARDQAIASVSVQQAAMIVAAEQLSSRLEIPGLLRAVTSDPVVPVARPELTDAVLTGVQGLRAAVRRPAQAAGENAINAAFQVFDRELAGRLDVSLRIDNGVHVVEVGGAGDDRSLAAASAYLVRRVEDGRTALDEHERTVFTTFILGGMGEELRRQLNQARSLITAMNTSLKGIRTSNGIGVKINWRLEDDGTGLDRVLALIATADAVRTPAQNAELIDLLRRRVEEFYAADPSSGYAEHLAAALDYRRWHEVELIIRGPAEGQERRISRRAKLSEGETRFVSYIALFAAADSYLAGLGGTEMSLRLVLLDDAFAKVDQRTIAEFFGLLVDLDLDFVMSGHDLWGCFPQVPSLDVYEVRRRDGSSAVTTRVHWDGRNRTYLHSA